MNINIWPQSESLYIVYKYTDILIFNILNIYASYIRNYN